MIYMDELTMQSYHTDYSASMEAAAESAPVQDSLTKRDVDTMIQNALGSQAKVVTYHSKNYSEERLGFLGAHRHLVVIVRIEGSIEKEIHTFFLKSMPYDVEVQASMIEDCGAFEKETTFYEKIMPELLKSINDRSWISHCYLVKKDALVFEDLRTRNYSLKEKLLGPQALQSAVASLAKLHAASMLTEKRLGRRMDELYPNAFRESLFARNLKFHTLLENNIKVLVAVAKNLGLDPTNIPKMYDRMYELIQTSKTRRNVACHGDTKSFNLMFDDSRPLPKCILVDFQLVRYAPLSTDLLQLFYLNTTRSVREANEEEVIRHYHEQLCETLRESDSEIELPSLEDILQEYEELRLVGVVTCVTYWPINLMDSKLCADMTKDSNGFEDLMFGDRVEMTLEMMRKDPVYKSRMAECIGEAIQRSKKLLAL